jgi:hypothetical protein
MPCAPGRLSARCREMEGAVSRKHKMVVSAPGIPQDILPLFNPPPLLSTEDPNVYCRLLVGVTQDTNPTTCTDWMYVKDITDLRWELRRERRMGVFLIEGARLPIKDYGPPKVILDDPVKRAMLQYIQKESDEKGVPRQPSRVAPPRDPLGPQQDNKNGKRKKRTDRENGLWDAEVYLARIEPLGHNSKRIAALEARLAATYREFEHYRGSRTLRPQREPIIDVEYAPAPLHLGSPPVAASDGILTAVQSDAVPKDGINSHDLAAPGPSQQE